MENSASSTPPNSGLSGTESSLPPLTVTGGTTSPSAAPHGTSQGATHRRTVAIIVCGLVALTLAVFFQTIYFQFVDLDDGIYVTQNPYVRGISSEGIKWAWSTVSTRASANWHPLTWMSLQLDSQVFGLRPSGFHATNVLIHVCNTLLLFACLRKATGAIWRSAFVAALFAIHPLHVESVAWVAERKDVLSTFFGLLSIWAYIQHVTRREPGWIFMTGLLLVASLLSKAMFVTLPFVLLLLDEWPLRRLAHLPPRERWKILIREKAGLFTLVVIFSVVTILAQSSGEAVQTVVKYPIHIRVMNAIVGYGFYLAKTILPTRLAVFYPHPGSNVSLISLLVSFIAIGGIGWTSWKSRHRFPFLWFGFAFFLGTLVPVIGLVQVGNQAYADRYAYVPLIGLFVAIVWGVSQFAELRRKQIVGFACGVIAVVLCAGLSFGQTKTWQNSLTLYENAIAAVPGNAFCENNLGLVYERQGELEKAVDHYNRALEIDPKLVSALNNLAQLYQTQDKLPEARAAIERALEISPRHSFTNSLMAEQFVAEGDGESAVKYYQQAIRLSPFDTFPRENLATVLRALGKPDDALLEAKAWMKLEPENPRVMNTLATIMVDLEKPSEAETLYMKALKLEPNFTLARTNLGILKHRLGDFESAVGHFRLANKLDPVNPSIVENLVGALINAGFEASKQNRSLDAKGMLDEALEFHPTSFFGHFRMAQIAVDNGFREEARTHFIAALSPNADLKRVQPGDIALCHFHFGLLLAVQDELDEAQQHFEATLEIAPDFAPAQGALERTKVIREKMMKALSQPQDQPNE